VRRSNSLELRSSAQYGRFTAGVSSASLDQFGSSEYEYGKRELGQVCGTLHLKLLAELSVALMGSSMAVWSDTDPITQFGENRAEAAHEDHRGSLREGQLSLFEIAF